MFSKFKEVEVVVVVLGAELDVSDSWEAERVTMACLCCSSSGREMRERDEMVQRDTRAQGAAERAIIVTEDIFKGNSLQDEHRKRVESEKKHRYVQRYDLGKCCVRFQTGEIRAARNANIILDVYTN